MPFLLNTLAALVALAALAAATTVTVQHSHLPSISIEPFGDFSAALKTNATRPASGAFSSFFSAQESTQEPLHQLLEIVQATAAQFATNTQFVEPEDHVNEVAAEDGASNFAGLAEARDLRASSVLLEHLLTSTRVNPSTYRPVAHVHAADPAVRDLYEGFSNHVDANNGELYSEIVDKDFEKREQAVQNTLAAQVLKVEESTPIELPFFPSAPGHADENTIGGLEASIQGYKKDIQKFKDCDDDTKDISANDWCAADGDNTEAINEQVMDLKSQIESGLRSVQQAEDDNDRQRTRVVVAKEDVRAPTESREATLEALLDDMNTFHVQLEHQGTTVANMKANLGDVALRLIAGMHAQISVLNASATEARDEAQKWLDGDWHASVAETLRQCMVELAKQAQYVAKREVATHEVGGFDAARTQTDAGADRLLAEQKVAIDFVKTTIMALTKVQQHVATTRSDLVSTCDDYNKTIDDRHATILAKKEKLIAELYSWHDSYEYLPALKEQEMAKQDLKRERSAVKLICTGIVSPTYGDRCSNARASFNQAKSTKEMADNRVVTQKKARDQVLVDYGGYADLRAELTRRGVHLSDDVSEGQQGLSLLEQMAKAYSAIFSGGKSLTYSGVHT